MVKHSLRLNFSDLSLEIDCIIVRVTLVTVCFLRLIILINNQPINVDILIQLLSLTLGTDVPFSAKRFVKLAAFFSSLPLDVADDLFQS